MESLGNQKLQEKLQKSYCCNVCDYNTSRKSSFEKHLSTTKHQKVANGNQMETKIATFATFATFPTTPLKTYSCEHCHRKFQNRSGLWKHRNKDTCAVPNLKEEKVTDNTEIKDKDIIMALVKECSEMKNLVFKMLENGTNNHSHNTNTNTQNHTNSHNKAFNLQFFLNETCKNAMNLSDFIESIKLQLSDLVDIGESGYVENITKIIVKNLNKLDETERPIHCTDQKRETFYVKDEGTWQKEDEEKKRIKRVVKSIANKYFKMLPLYREKYPDYNDSDSRQSDKHSKMVIEVMTSDSAKDDKIVRNVSRITTIKSNK